MTPFSPAGWAAILTAAGLTWGFVHDGIRRHNQTRRVGAGRKHTHTLKFEVHSIDVLSSSSEGFRWPALRADAGYQNGYGGSVPEARMGALVALPPTYDLASLETEPAKIVATTLQRYGAYIVDGTGWSTAAFAVEWSPAGRVRDEFEEVWGFATVGDIQSSSGRTEGLPRGHDPDLPGTPCRR